MRRFFTITQSLFLIVTSGLHQNIQANDYFDQNSVYIDEVHTINGGTYRNVVLEILNSGNGHEYQLKQASLVATSQLSTSQALSAYSSLNQSLYLANLESRQEGLPGNYEVMLEAVSTGASNRFRVRSARKINSSISALAQQLQSIETEALIDEIRQENHSVGVSIAIIKGKQTIWSQGFGYADLEKQIQVTANTPFRLGSVSKTFLGVAMMQAVEKGLLGLEQPINTVSPYPIVHPSFTTSEITFKQLAGHTSGITDTAVYNCSYYYTATPELNLFEQLSLNEGYQCPQGFSRQTDQFIQEYTSSGVRGYAAHNNFNDHQPGSVYDYSNVAAGLAGQLIGIAHAKSINKLIQEQIFFPLMMVNSGYFADDFAGYAHRSKGYIFQDGVPNVLEDYAYPTFADGSLYSSANDLARYLIALANDGELNGIQILTAESTNTLFTPIITDQNNAQHAVFWELNDNLAYHSGGDPGVSSLILLDREEQLGIVILANTTDIEGEENVVGVLAGVLLSIVQATNAQSGK